MTKNLNLSEKRSIVTFTHTLRSATTAFFSWQTIAKMYQYMSLGLEEHVTVNDAKGYTKVALVVIISIVLDGLVEGGAL